MTWELAKKLEDAGFHVRPIDEVYIKRTKDSFPEASGCVIIEIKNGQEVQIPTLEELVEFIQGPQKLEEMIVSYANRALKKLNYEE